LSLASALRDRDVAELPSRRDEDWRWTDLRALIRVLPEPSAAIAAESLGDGPFAAMAGATHVLANGQGRVRIEAGREPAVIALRVISRGDGSHAGHAAILVPAGGDLTLLESYEGDAGGYVSQATLTISLGEGARLERIVLADDGAEGVTVSQAEVQLAPGAAYAQTVLTTGGRRQRIETRLNHPGGHARVRMDGVYLLSGKAHADQTTQVIHAAPDGTTSQLVKGVVRDQARGVFQGRIVVAEGADRTDARMGHHALVLSDRAEVDAKPELEIYADDVSCAHGNTVGALDEDALFYAEQRGIPEDAARAMLTEAFVGQVIDRIEHEAARDVARAWAAGRLV
jgi:Fe-S cluster assembly protein SufD